jgi:hypothetical protein
MEERKPTDNRLGWIGMDLDGTLAHYSPTQGDYDIGEPIPAMMETVHKLLAQGREVRIFTARACDPKAIPYVQRWLNSHGLGHLQITNCKDYDLDYFYDDKALEVVFNTGYTIRETHHDLLNAHERLLKNTNFI